MLRRAHALWASGLQVRRLTPLNGKVRSFRGNVRLSDYTSTWDRITPSEGTHTTPWPVLNFSTDVDLFSAVLQLAGRVEKSSHYILHIPKGDKLQPRPTGQWPPVCI
jgi:hypothetical protein